MNYYVPLLKKRENMPIGDALGALGMQAGGNIVGEGLGIAFQGIKNKQQLAQARKLQNLSLEGEATRLQRNQTAALQMWKDTNYGAQVEEMKKAGINPALLYGMGGGGGATAQVQGAATSGQSAGTAQASQGGAGMGLMMPQMELIKAQTDKTRAEEAKTKAETPGAQKDSEFKADSYEDRLDIIRGTFTKLQEEINQINRNNSIGEATKQDQINQIKAEAVGTALKNELTKAQTSATNQQEKESIQRVMQSEAEIKKWTTELTQGWTRLNIQEQEMRIKAFEAEMRANMPGLSNVMGGVFQGMINGIKQLMNINPREGNLKPK